MWRGCPLNEKHTCALEDNICSPPPLPSQICIFKLKRTKICSRPAPLTVQSELWLAFHLQVVLNALVGHLTRLLQDGESRFSKIHECNNCQNPLWLTTTQSIGDALDSWAHPSKDANLNKNTKYDSGSFCWLHLCRTWQVFGTRTRAPPYYSSIHGANVISRFIWKAF